MFLRARSKLGRLIILIVFLFGLMKVIQYLVEKRKAVTKTVLSLSIVKILLYLDFDIKVRRYRMIA